MTTTHPIDGGIIDLFSGAGGWLEGLREIDPQADHLGIEVDGLAHAASIAAGHTCLRADVTALDPLDYRGRYRKLIASPPCQSFSVTGAGAGRAAMDAVIAALHSGDITGIDDVKTRLTVEPWRWITALEPDWILMEQVPPVLPVWQVYVEKLREIGYDATAAVISAEQYGVPQTRRRAVLVASKVGKAVIPDPVHSAYRRPDPTLPAPVGLGEALHVPDDGRRQRSNYSAGGPPGARTAAERGRTMRDLDEPSVTITRRPPQWAWNAGTPQERRETFTVAECGQLQSFRADFPWQGTRSDQRLQAGNAVPPKLAEALIAGVESL